MPKVGDSFDTRHNSLNFLRLVLAVMVLVSHAIPLGGFGGYTIHDRTTLGTVAVFGFFGISGYLVGQSASRNSVGRYLWQRCLRIFPGFWVCLGVMVAVFGTIGWHQLGRHTGLTAFWTSQGTPYVAHNFFLRINHPYVLGTQTYHGLPLIDSSLWTLFYEFLCYLILAVLAVTRLFRRRWFVLTLTAVIWVVEAVVVLTQYQGLSFDLMAMISFVPVFLTGTLLYLFRDEMPDSGWIALALGVVVVASAWAPFGRTTYNALTNYVTAGSSVDLLGPAIVYPLLWLGAHLPLQKVGSRNDYSYGVYIYAFPVSRLLAMWNVQRFGFVAYIAAIIVCTAPFAVASWWVVERTALKFRKVDPKAVNRWVLGPVASSRS